MTLRLMRQFPLCAQWLPTPTIQFLLRHLRNGRWNFWKRFLLRLPLLSKNLTSSHVPSLMTLPYRSSSTVRCTWPTWPFTTATASTALRRCILRFWKRANLNPSTTFIPRSSPIRRTVLRSAVGLWDVIRSLRFFSIRYWVPNGAIRET